MMNSLRNVQDVAPAGVDFAVASRLAGRVARDAGFELGGLVMPVFERLGGTYHPVVSTFGRRGDSVVVAPGPALHAEDRHYPGVDDPSINETLAEALGHLFLHYPAARERYGDTVVLGVPRFSETPAQGEARGEAVAFAIGFLMPQDLAIAAFADGLDDAAVANRFGVTRRLAGARRHALKRFLAIAA